MALLRNVGHVASWPFLVHRPCLDLGRGRVLSGARRRSLSSAHTSARGVSLAGSGLARRTPAAVPRARCASISSYKQDISVRKARRHAFTCVEELFEIKKDNGHCSREDVESRWPLLEPHLPSICMYPGRISLLLHSCQSLARSSPIVQEMVVSLADHFSKQPPSSFVGSQRQRQIRLMLSGFRQCRIVPDSLPEALCQNVSFAAMVGTGEVAQAVGGLTALNVSNVGLALSAVDRYLQLPASRFRRQDLALLLSYCVLCGHNHPGLLSAIDATDDFLGGIHSSMHYVSPFLSRGGPHADSCCRGPDFQRFLQMWRRLDDWRSHSVLSSAIGGEYCAGLSVVNGVPVGAVAVLDAAGRFVARADWPDGLCVASRFDVRVAARRGLCPLALSVIPDSSLLTQPRFAPTGFQVSRALSLTASGCLFVPVRHVSQLQRREPELTVVPQLAVNYPTDVAPFSQWVSGGGDDGATRSALDTKLPSP